MDQLVIFILVIIGSIISSIIQNKKKRDAERQGLPPPPGQGPFENWPETTAEWQKQLRRLLEPEKEEAPPVIAPPPPPVITKPKRTPLVIERSEGDEEISATGKLSERVHRFMHAGHKPSMEQIAAPSLRKKHRLPSHLTWIRKPQAVREAFIASLIFSPPPSLDRR